MMILNDKDEKVLLDYLRSYKECFEAMDNLLSSIVKRVPLTGEEIKLNEISKIKYKNMVYHLRKWNPELLKIKK